MASLDLDNLRLTDFLDLSILQEIQDSFAAVANVKATITDAEGRVLTDPTPAKSFLDKQRAIAAAEESADRAGEAAARAAALPAGIPTAAGAATLGGGGAGATWPAPRLARPAAADGTARVGPPWGGPSRGGPSHDGAAGDGPQRDGDEYVAPIVVNNQRLGTLRMRARGTAPLDDGKVASLAEKTGLEARQIRALIQQITKGPNTRPAAIQFLYLLANSIARLCYQEYQLRQRIAELTAVYQVTMMLADARDLNKVLQRTVEVVCDLMQVKASSIRLIDRDRDELVIRAVHHLTPRYLAKGPIRLSSAEIDQAALSPKGFEYVPRMSEDPRVLYPQESSIEGIVSMISVGMRYKGRPVGVLRVYTEEERAFTPLQVDLLKAVAAQAAAAIENARLLAERREAEQLEEQVRMARDVQQRMMPHHPPQVPGLEFASVYDPCYTLGGDFYDFIPLPGDNIGLVVADVSGKGVPASLIMASVRAALRAHVDNLYYLYEVMRRINLMLCRDTQPSEFVTLLYGVLDTHNRRLTYCNAGHPPGLLLREGKLIELASDNLVLGVDPNEPYQQTVIDLKGGDLLLLYTDGLTDAMNFRQQPYGRQRLVDAFVKGGDTAEHVAHNLLWEMRRFVGLSKRTDDVTMMVVKVG